MFSGDFALSMPRPGARWSSPGLIFDSRSLYLLPNDTLTRPCAALTFCWQNCGGCSGCWSWEASSCRPRQHRSVDFLFWIMGSKVPKRCLKHLFPKASKKRDTHGQSSLRHRVVASNHVYCRFQPVTQWSWGCLSRATGEEIPCMQVSADARG